MLTAAMDAAKAPQSTIATPASFAVERTLGRLGKWLRLMGFDTLSELDYPRGDFMRHIGAERIFLTRTQRLRDSPGRKTLFIRANDPVEQAVDLIRQAAIRAEDLRPFTRCILCNEKTEAVARSAVPRPVPDYVWNSQTHFSACPKCGRVYWRGSHTERALRKLGDIFTAAGFAKDGFMIH
jgi:uncharacterized protein with PIN domain